MIRTRVFGLTAAAIVFALDQVSKSAVLTASNGISGWGIDILPIFNLVMVRNTGVSFGLLSGGIAAWWVLSAVALTVTVFLFRWLWRERNLLVATGLGLIIGGALGNVVDRWRHGAVTDFLDFHAAGWHWPAFNLADVGIVTGVAAIIWNSFFAPDQIDAERRVQ